MIAKNTTESKKILSGTVPDAYICPLTNNIMIDPLVSRYGVSYERAAIIDHIANQLKPYCPVTKQTLSFRDLVPNVKLRVEISLYRYKVLGEDFISNIQDEDELREVECTRAIAYALCHLQHQKKGFRKVLRFCPGWIVKKN